MLNMELTNELTVTDSLTAAPSRLSSPEFQRQIFSKVMTLEQQLNPLVSAALPLLTLTFELQERTHEPDLQELHLLLTHEIQVMEQRSLQQGYRSQIILAARYIICAYVDEMIYQTSWGKNSDWDEHNLLSTFHREASDGEHFFLILERSAEEPAFFIDALELGYLCLKLGFQGKYRKNANSIELENVTDNLYHLIRQVRGEIHKNLFISAIAPKVKKIKSWILPSTSTTIISLIIFLLCIFIPYHERLEVLVMPTHQAIETFTIQKNGQDHAST